MRSTVEALDPKRNGELTPTKKLFMPISFKACEMKTSIRLLKHDKTFSTSLCQPEPSWSS